MSNDNPGNLAAAAQALADKAWREADLAAECECGCGGAYDPEPAEQHIARYISPDGSEASDRPYTHRPAGSDGLGEDGLDVGAIENGYVLTIHNEHADGSVTVVGPFRSEREARIEADDMEKNGIPLAHLLIEPVFRPYAGIGVQLRVTDAEAAEYYRLMALAPLERTAHDEKFIEAIGEIMWAETTNEGTDGWDKQEASK